MAEHREDLACYLNLKTFLEGEKAKFKGDRSFYDDLLEVLDAAADAALGESYEQLQASSLKLYELLC